VGVSFEFAEVSRVLRMTLDGELTDEALLDAWSQAMTVAASLPPYNTIVDLSGVTSVHISSSVVANISQSPPFRPDQPARVLVATRDVTFGMARMFQMRSEGTRTNLHVVRSVEEAYRVLGIEAPVFAPLRFGGNKSSGGHG
jgi:hypothetical protein